MKSTLDTNIFIYGPISGKIAKLIEDNKRSASIVLLTVSNEAYPKLISLYTIFSIFQEENLKNPNPEKLIDSKRYLDLQNEFPQVYSTFKRFIIQNKLNSIEKAKKLDSIILEILNSIRISIQIIQNQETWYPLNETEFEEIRKSTEYKACLENISLIINNEGDRQHLCLCNQFIQINLQKKEQLKFVTLDKEDFVKHSNKEKIEQLVSNLEIENIELDLENIKLLD